MKIGDTVTIKSGFGHYDCTDYPPGGCFKRSVIDITGTIQAIDNNPKSRHSQYGTIYLLANGKKLLASIPAIRQ